MSGAEYLTGVVRILGEIVDNEMASIREAAELVAESIAGDGLVHAFGTGHSHVLAEELFYRAGGLAAVNPILVADLMLHVGAERSTELERTSGLADRIAQEVRFSSGDTLIVASNSGGNAVCEELATIASHAGVKVVAIVSSRHTAAAERDGRGLSSIADVVVDNHGAVGDASVTIEGIDRKVGATSTVAGAAIVNAIVAEAASILTNRGVPVEVFQSSNVPGGDEVNHDLVERYRSRVKAL